MSETDLLKAFLYVLEEVSLALAPLLLIFLLFQLVLLKMPRDFVINAVKGLLLAFAGLLLFLYGVLVGFLPAGTEIGKILGGSDHRWVLVPVGFLLGFLATMAEPAVRILSEEVQGQSGGYVGKNVILFTLSAGVAVLVALGMARVVFRIPFYYIIIPGYALALVITIARRPAFTSVAFDSGGVATGPMTVTFIMAIAIGAAEMMEGGDAVETSFGLIALVALAPIISVLVLSLLYSRKEGSGE